MPPNLVTTFGAPALQKGAELLADQYFDEKIAENQQQRDQFVKLLIDRAAAKDPSVLLQTNLTDFERVYNIAQADLSGLKRDDLPAYNRVMTKYAYEYLNEHRSQLQANTARLDELSKAVNETLPAHIDDIKKKVDDEFRKVGSSIAALTRKQEEHTQILDSLQTSVKENQERITALEKQMVDVQHDVDQLKSVQAQHSKLIAENTLKINILTGYMFQTLNTDQKLNGLKQGHFDSVFGCSPGQQCAKKDELVSKLEKLKTTETIISVANTVTASLNAGVDVLTSLKLLKGEDAKRVGRFVHVVGSVLQVGTGVAKIFAGDISGILNVLGGIGSLFGSGPQKSPELQFLEQMYDQMIKEFEAVQQNLAIIDKKIDQLGEVMVDMYKAMMASFEYVNEKLDRADWKLDVLQSITRQLLFKEYNTCKTVEYVRTENQFDFSKYSDYRTFYSTSTHVGTCLNGLDDFTSTEALDFFYLAVNEGTLSSLLESNDYTRAKASIEFEIRKVFNPTRDLFVAKYPNKYLGPAKAALFFPVLSLKGTNNPLFIISTDDVPALNLGPALNDYINYEMVNQFADLMLTYSPYFEISGGVDNAYRPLELDLYLTRPGNEKRLNAAFQIKRFQKLLRVTNYAILQQSLVAGNLLIEPTYSVLFTANQKDEQIRMALEALQNNSIFAANFAAYLLHKNLRISEKPIGIGPSPSRYKELDDLYNKLAQNPGDAASIEALNKLVYLNDFKFKMNPADKSLYITISRTGRSVDLRVPAPNTIADNQMIQTSAVIGLLETRRKLINRLEEICFTRSLPLALSGTSLTLDDFKYFYTAH